MRYTALEDVTVVALNGQATKHKRGDYFNIELRTETERLLGVGSIVLGKRSIEGVPGPTHDPRASRCVPSTGAAEAHQEEIDALITGLNLPANTVMVMLQKHIPNAPAFLEPWTYAVLRVKEKFSMLTAEERTRLGDSLALGRDVGATPASVDSAGVVAQASAPPETEPPVFAKGNQVIYVEPGKDTEVPGNVTRVLKNGEVRVHLKGTPSNQTIKANPEHLSHVLPGLQYDEV